MSFIDTNVLVHATAAGFPNHGRARKALARIASEGPLAISRQVLREYLAVATRPQVWAKPLTLAEALADTDGFSRRFAILEDGLPVWDRPGPGPQAADPPKRQAHSETMPRYPEPPVFRAFNRRIASPTIRVGSSL
nr:PIN domain-containing protein [uncultured Rhodopila sp.]